MSTHHTPEMDIRDLIELNMLHSLGLLDQDEHDAYERALTQAPQSIRDRVFAESRRLADLGDLLPDEQPTPELREMVLAAVRAAITEQTQPAPAPAPASAPVIARITHDTPRRAQPALPTGNRVHSIWRAAAIGLAAATVALTVVSAQNRAIYNQLDNQFLIAEAYDTMGAEFVESMLMDPNSKRVAFTATSTTSPASAVASVWHNADWNVSQLFVKNLKPAEQPYRLVVLDPQGNIVREITEFVPTGELEAIRVNFNPATDTTLAIIDPQRVDQPLLTSL